MSFLETGANAMTIYISVPTADGQFPCQHLKCGCLPCSVCAFMHVNSVISPLSTLYQCNACKFTEKTKAFSFLDTQTDPVDGKCVIAICFRKIAIEEKPKYNLKQITTKLKSFGILTVL